MKLSAQLALATALTLLAVPAMAQSSSSSSSMLPDPTSSAPVSELAANVDNYGSLISSLQAGAVTDLTTITAATTVNIVTVSTIKANGNSNALDNALDKNKDA